MDPRHLQATAIENPTWEQRVLNGGLGTNMIPIKGASSAE